MLQEGLAARVCCQKWGWEEASKRCHGQDQTALARDHAWCEKLGDTEGRHAIDHDDVVHLLLLCLGEWHGDAVTQTHVVNQDADIKTIGKLLQAVIIRVLVQGKVHSQSFGRELGTILRGDVGSERIKLGLGTRNEDEIVALSCESESEFLANAIRCTSDKGPCAAGSICSELQL